MFIGIIAFGSLWGALEATLGGMLHLVNFPYTGVIMANIGFTIMAAAVAVYKKPSILPGIAFIAASFKLLAVLLLSMSPFAQKVVNPAVAIILESLAFQVAVSLLWKPWLNSRLARAGAGLAGMYLAYIGISLVFFYILGRGPKEVATPVGLMLFALQDGVLAALIAGVAAPLGYRFGEFLQGRVGEVVAANPKLFYGGAAATIALCWIAGALSLLV